MTGKRCPVGDCDFGDDEEKSPQQVMGHITSTNDDAHDWEALKGEVMGGDEGGTDPSEGGTDDTDPADQPESGDGEADDTDPEGGSEGASEGDSDGGSDDADQQAAILAERAKGESNDGEAEDTDSEGGSDGGSDGGTDPSGGGSGGGKALAFVTATLALALAVLAAAGSTDDDHPEEDVIDVENQAAESNDDEPTDSPQPAW